MGKTTIANFFKEFGCPIFDADKAVHDLYVQGGQGYKLIKAVHPKAITPKGVNRQILAEFIKSDPLHLPVLESFMHPWVGTMRAEFLDKARQDGERLVILDIPLLFETGAENSVDYIIVASAPDEIQKQRIMARPNMSAEKMQLLLSRQMPNSEKCRRADFIISTGLSLEKTRKQAEEIYNSLISI